MQANLATAWRINNDELSWQAISDGSRQNLPEVIGNCSTRLFSLDQDFNFIETHYTPNRNLAILSRIPQQEPRIVLTLSLTGQSCFRGQHGYEIKFKAGYSTITTFNFSEGSRLYQANHSISQLRFSMTQRWLENYFGEGTFANYFKENSLQVLSHQPSTPSALLAGHNLVCNTLASQAQPLFRKGQAMSIVASELGQLLSNNQRIEQFSPRDKQIAEWARDILVSEFKHPPSVTELSKRVGTNPFKLKQLFHSYFNTTPYGFVLDIKMQKANQLLSTSRLPINRVAEAIGYQHASNFSTAFLKYFGCPPKQISGKHSTNR